MKIDEKYSLLFPLGVVIVSLFIGAVLACGGAFLAWALLCLFEGSPDASGELEGPRCCAPAARAAERDAGSVAGLFAKAAEKTSREKRAADAREEETPETFATTAETFGSAAGAARRADAKKKKVGAPSPSRERKRARTATTFAKTKQRSVADLFGGKPRSERG